MYAIKDSIPINVFFVPLLEQDSLATAVVISHYQIHRT